MQETAKRFREILSAELSLHKQLLALSKDKREAIVNNNVDDIDQIVKSEQILLAQLSEYERHRREQVTKLAEHLNKKYEDVVLSDAFPFCTDELRSELEGINAEMKEVLSEQVKCNNVNRGLIESRLEFINFAVETMSTSSGQSNTYGAAGNDTNKVQRKHSFLDKSV